MRWEIQEGGDIWLWLTHVDVWQKPAQYCKAIILHSKLKKNHDQSPPSKSACVFQYLFIYLVALGITCSTQDLNLCWVMQGLSMQSMDSPV